MGNKEKAEQRPVLPRTYGALSGLAAAETESIGRVIGPLADVVERGIEPYDKLTHGLGLWAVDPQALARKRRYEKYLGVPHVKGIAFPESATLPRQTIEVLEGHPRIFGEETSGVAKFLRPFIFLKNGDPAVIAHEVGHNVRSPIASASTLVRARNDILRSAAMGAGIGLALSDNETAEKYAPLVSVAPHIPELLEEARASTHGIRAIRAIEGNRAAIKSLTTLLPAFMTYVVSAIPSLTAPMIAKAVKEYSEQKQEKTASKKAVGSKIKSARSSWVTAPPKPKTSKIGKPGTSPPKPPSKSKFYKDMLGELNGLGTRRA